MADYTNYARGKFADYYQCYGPGTGYAVPNPNPPGYGDPNLTSTCFSPSSTWQETERNEHMSNEIRLSTPDDWRVRGIVGVFNEQNKLFDQTDWLYKTIPACTSNGAPGTLGNSGCLSNVGTVPTATTENPGVQNDNVAFFEDTQREVKQTAVFGSVDFDIIPKVLTVTAGTRHYRFDNSFTGSVTGSFYCFEQGNPAGGCLNDATNLNAKNLNFVESGTKSRGNISWHVTPDVMLYATWSQGFRPGGFNRNGGPASFIDGPDGKPQFAIPNEYHSDDLTNKEIGWKTEWFDHHVQWNGAIYQENWNNVQIGFFDPGETGNLSFGTNGQDFRIRGVETTIVARVTQGLTVQGGGSWNSSVQTNSPQLIDTNPASVNFGKEITEQCDKTGANCTPINNLFGPPGGPSANSPPIQLNLRARYDWMVNNYNAFVQFGGQHTGHSYTQSGNDPALSAKGINTTLLRFENPAYSTFDASLGVAKDAWSAHLYSQNLFNKETSLFTNTAQFAVAQTALRPRVIGVKFGYKF